MSEIEIFIVDMRGKERPFTVSSTDTIKMLKDKYHEINSSLIVPVLKLDGEILNDDLTIEESGIEDGDRILVIERSRGG